MSLRSSIVFPLDERTGPGGADHRARVRRVSGRRGATGRRPAGRTGRAEEASRGCRSAVERHPCGVAGAVRHAARVEGNCRSAGGQGRGIGGGVQSRPRTGAVLVARDIPATGTGRSHHSTARAMSGQSTCVAPHARPHRRRDSRRIRRRLKPFITIERYEPSRSALPETLYHLVSRENIDAYLAAASRISRPASPAPALSGPFPPYAFVPEILG